MGESRTVIESLTKTTVSRALDDNLTVWLCVYDNLQVSQSDRGQAKDTFYQVVKGSKTEMQAQSQKKDGR